MALKRQTIKIHGQLQIDRLNQLAREAAEQPGVWCFELKKYQEAKTLQQLRALFGVWYTYLREELGYTKDELHQFHKTGKDGDGGWLIEIYANDPHGDSQYMWLEIFARFHDDVAKHGDEIVCNSPEFITHMKRLSLSWATIKQMREYMNRIEQYYISAEYPLPILEQYRTAYIGGKK